jgi:hypothetical protein
MKRSARFTPEDKIHIGLLLAIGALAGALILGRAPGDPRRVPTAAAVAGSVDTPLEPTRAELDACIEQLKVWVERSHDRAGTALELSLGLQGLGLRGLGQGGSDRDAPPARAMAKMLAEGNAAASLAMLLEAGVSLDRELPLETGGVSVRQLVEAELQKSREVQPARHEPDAWQLDLLSFATLGGLTQYRERLAQLTQRSLSHLDRQYRDANARQGAGKLEALDLKQLAEVWEQRGGPNGPATDELHISAAVFRAVAVLAEPELEQRARRHLSTLLFSYQTDRALHHHLLTTSADPGRAIAVRLAALESLGRLEQALYSAHLAFRREARPDPAPRTASVMRQAAHDLIDHWQHLRQTALFEPQHGEVAGGRSELMRAAVHALRGLRTARIAV